MFQNHYGWIETGDCATLKWCEVDSFKTTTVGLRPGVLTLFIVFLLLFQNHYGWIETWKVPAYVYVCKGFKTTTVGLRLYRSGCDGHGTCSFKTTTVGLRPYI